MRRNEIRRKLDDIVAFAEVEKFIDTPVKRYSSGMFVRLAFAVAAHLEPAYEGFTERSLPVTERLTARTLILPLFHDLTEPEQDLVVSVIVAARQDGAQAYARS